MNKNILITIITPVFNGEQYIQRYFENIQSLDYKNLQIIIVNDGSSDNSAELINRYLKTDSRVLFINKIINAGVSKARNDALKQVQGDWVFFFDCDDTFEPNIISACLKIIKNKSDTVCYNYASVRKNGDVCPHIFTYSKQIYKKEEISKEVLPYSFGISIDELKLYLMGKRDMRQGKELNGPWRIMYSMEVIKREKLSFNETLQVGEDTIFTNEYLAVGDNIRTLNSILYYLHNNENSVIDVYNQDVVRMINGKLQLINAKNHLTNRLKKRGIDVYALWGGEYILSSVQIGWILASNKKIKYGQKIKILKKYHKSHLVRDKWKSLSINEIVHCKSIKAIPILLMKCNLIVLTETMLCMLNRLGYSIS